jgi:hypothetical protein
VLKFLREKGGGLHHFCYETHDLEVELKSFRSRQAILVRNPGPPSPSMAAELLGC